jgi:hypothetical protein
MLDTPRTKNRLLKLAVQGQQRKMMLAGFDPGRSYTAFAVIRGNVSQGFKLYRHGFIYPPDLGSTANFGSSLLLWDAFFENFLRNDLKVDAFAVERFIKMQGSAGSAAEDVNLRVGRMVRPGGFLVRNVDWKSWMKRHIHEDGAPAVFRTPTPHEADAAGIALYLGSVLLPRLHASE